MGHFSGAPGASGGTGDAAGPRPATPTPGPGGADRAASVDPSPTMRDLDAKLEREGRFWDARQAQDHDPEAYRVDVADRHDRSVPWLPYLGFGANLDSVLAHLGDLSGQRILDLGCGTGFLSCVLAARGARVDAVDVSEASLAVARWRAAVSGVADRIAFHHAPAERLGFPDATFDAACGLFVLHHLDLPVAAVELRRVLRPGARAAFVETCGGSRVLMAARRVIPGRLGIEKASSEDERPLGVAARAVLLRVFGDAVSLDYPDPLFFRMLSYVPPLHRRPAQRVLSALDGVLQHVRGLRHWSYFGVIRMQAPAMLPVAMPLGG